MIFGSNHQDSDDMFSESRMTFGEHIEELRKHLLRAIVGFVIALCGSIFIGEPVLQFIAAPVERELLKFHIRRVEKAVKKLEEGDTELTESNQPKEIELLYKREQLVKKGFVLRDPAPDDPDPDSVQLTASWKPVDIAIALAKAERLVGRPPTLSTMAVTEAFVVYMKVCIYCGIIISSPWIFYQLWSFVAAGLYPHEKRYINLYLPISLGLFLAGVALCEFVVIPKAVEYLLSFNEWIGLEPDLRLSEWLSFAIIMPLVFGAAFQTPLVMLFLERIGIMNVDTYRKHRRIAMFLLACVAVILSASPDAFSMLSLTIPLWGLYELGILMCRLSPRRAPLDLDVPDSEEMVEV